MHGLLLLLKLRLCFYAPLPGLLLLKLRACCRALLLAMPCYCYPSCVPAAMPCCLGCCLPSCAPLLAMPCCLQTDKGDRPLTEVKILRARPLE